MLMPDRMQRAVEHSNNQIHILCFPCLEERLAFKALLSFFFNLEVIKMHARFISSLLLVASAVELYTKDAVCVVSDVDLML